MSRPIGTVEELERRRKRAVPAVADGQSRKTVAQVLGVHIKIIPSMVRRDTRAAGRQAPARADTLKGRHRRVDPRTVIRDRNPIHSTSKAVQAWVAKHPGVVVEDFPGYVPELNPDEGVWGRTKCGRLANLTANSKQELWGHVVDELIAPRHRPDPLRALIQETRLLGLALAV